MDQPSELLDLLAWIRAAAEPLAPRLAAQLRLVEQAAMLLTLPTPSAAALGEIAHASSAIAKSAAPLPPTDALISASDERIWWEVTGLLASDGHFAVRDRHARFAPVASVSQRMDNAVLLEALRERTGIGDLIRQEDQLSWRITRGGEMVKLVERLRIQPLPLVSPRRWQFEVWATAVALKATGRRGREALAATADALRSARRYRGPALICSCAEPGTESS